MGIDHHDISTLAAVGQQVVCQLVGALVDLPIREDPLRGARALGLKHAEPVGMAQGVGCEDIMDGLE